MGLLIVIFSRSLRKYVGRLLADTAGLALRFFFQEYVYLL